MGTSGISKENFNSAEYLLLCARSKVNDMRKESSGLYGVRKMFEWAMDALFEAYGEGSDSSIWHPVEDKVLQKGAEGWREFWHDMEKIHPGVSREISRLNPSSSPLSDFLTAYRYDVSDKGLKLDIATFNGQKVYVSPAVIDGLLAVISAFERQIGVNTNKGCLSILFS